MIEQPMQRFDRFGRDLTQPLPCYLHDRAITDDDKQQTMCHCWDHVDLWHAEHAGGDAA